MEDKLFPQMSTGLLTIFSASTSTDADCPAETFHLHVSQMLTDMQKYSSTPCFFPQMMSDLLKLSSIFYFSFRMCRLPC